MQAEYKNNRGNGFIVVPTESVASTYSSKKPQSYAIPETLTAVKDNLKEVGAAYSTYARKSSKAFILKLLSSIAVIGCTALFFHFFTFATGVYYNGEKIAVAPAKEHFSSALSSAIEIASSEGIRLSDTYFSTAPVLSLRQDVLSASRLKDELLVSSGSFINGYTVFSNDTPIFSTENEETANKAISQYLEVFSMNGSADVSHTLTCKPAIIKKSTALSQAEGVSTLQASTDVSVVSVVNTTTSRVIPFETSTENDDSLYIGEQITVTEGQNGSAEICEETVYENGTQQTSRIASKKIVLEPVKQVVKIGTKQKKVLDSGLVYPLRGRLSSPFGSRWGRMHEGIDIAVPEGTDVTAAECGTVSYVSENAGGYGKLVKIDHGHGVETAYAHLSKINVNVGDAVSSSTVIAQSGNTGRSTGPHLHFEIVDNGTPVDPLNYLKD